MKHAPVKRWNRRVRVGLGGLAVTVGLISAIGGPYRPVEPLPDNIIDMHCHAAGIGAGGSGCFISEKLRKSWKYRTYLKSFGLNEAAILKQGDQLLPDTISRDLAKSVHVQKAVLLAMDGVIAPDGTLDTNRTEMYVPNEFILDAVGRHTNLLFGASINPYRPDALERLQWAKDHGAVLVKWLPSIMKIDPSDPALIPFYRKMAELDLPLLSHTGKERSFSKAEDEFADPEKLRLPLSLGVRVIAAHIASTGKYHGEASTERLARLMLEYPNAYSDISSLTQLNKLRYMRIALTRPEFSGRLVYGSDYPLINTPAVSPWYYSLRLKPWTTAQLACIRNPWDADVRLKQSLGTPASVFSRFDTIKSNPDQARPSSVVVSRDDANRRESR